MPEIKTREDLEAWLRDKPRDWAQAVAVRAAMRVAPLVGTTRAARSRRDSLLVAVFRANHISWAARKYPAHDMAAYAADAAAYAADAAAARAAAARAAAARAAAAAAAYAAAAYAARAAAARAAYAADAAARAAAARAAAVYAAAASDAAAMWESIERDVMFLDRSGGDAASLLVRQALWLREAGAPRNSGSTMPSWAADAWRETRGDLAFQDEGFGVWFDWYDSILRGTGSGGSAFGSELDVRIAMQPGAWWKREPKEVNADIAEWVRERLTRDDHRPTISDFILLFLSGRNSPSSVQEILSAFQAANFNVVPKTVRGELSRLATSGRVRRVRTGVYASVVSDAPDLAQQGPGTKFSADETRKLDTRAILPSEFEKSDPTQRDLLSRLQRKVPLFGKSGNFPAEYPILSDVLDDYLSVIRDKPVEEIDINALWMTGAGLISQARSFAALNPEKQVTNPLEPQLQALLGECAMLHGALIMGFEEGRNLAERARVPQLSGEELRALFANEKAIVRWLLTSKEFELSDRARAVFERIDHHMVAASENLEDAAMLGYPTIRNLLIFAGHAARSLETILGRASLAGVPVHVPLIGLGAFLVQNAAPIVGVASSVPELQTYFQWLFERLEIRYREERKRDLN